MALFQLSVACLVVILSHVFVRGEEAPPGRSSRGAFDCGQLGSPAVVWSEAFDVRTPNYPSPYPPGTSCSWVFDSGQSQMTQLKFTDFCTSDSDSVTLYDGNNTTAPVIYQHSGCNGPPVAAMSTGQALLLNFVTSQADGSRGFHLTHNFFWSACGSPSNPQVYTWSPGSIASVNYPDQYPSNLNCGQLFVAYSGQVVSLTFDWFCTNEDDYGTLYDGSTTAAPVIAQFSGCQQQSRSILSSGREILFTFRSSGNTTGPGYLLNWQFVTPDNTTCGSVSNPVIISGPSSGNLSSPDYPSNYPRNLNCAWLLSAGVFDVVTVWFDDFCTGTEDKVTLYDGPSTTDPVIYTHSGCYPPTAALSTGQEMLITFTTDSSSATSERGFALTYTFTEPPCGSDDEPMLITGVPTGNLTSTGYPHFYPASHQCTWLFAASPGEVVSIWFNDFCTEPGHMFRAYDGRDTNDPLIYEHSGCSTPVSMVSSGQLLYLTFSTNGSGSNRGFNLYWQFGLPPCGNSLEPIVITVGPSGYIETVNFPGPYPTNLDCNWLLVANPGEVVLIDFQSFCVHEDDQVAVYDGETTGSAMILSHTGCALPRAAVTSDYLMLITFRSSGLTTNSGFRLGWQFMEPVCGHPLVPEMIEGDGISGNLTSVNWPNPYPTNMNCVWQMKAATGQMVSLQFNSFCTENTRDYLRVYEGTSQVDPEIYSLSGCFDVPNVMTARNEMLLTFSSDSSAPYPGFNIFYAFVPGCGSPSSPVVISGPFSGTLTSPNYPHLYPATLDCAWLFVGTQDQTVQLSFTDFCTESCCDVVTIQDGGQGQANFSHSGCSVPANFISTQSSALLLFSTDGSVQERGFSVNYEFQTTIDCGSPTSPIDIWYVQSGWISSPNYPGNYPNNLNCGWRLNAYSDQYIRVNFHDFCTESCCDHVRLYDGRTTSDNQITTINGCWYPHSWFSSGSYMLITFITDGSVTDRGFNMTWEFLYQANTDITVTDSYTSVPSACGSPTSPIDIWYEQTGWIASPNYPGNYPNNLNCGWRLIAYSWQYIHVNFHDFCTESCCDHVRLYDGRSTSDRLITTINGCSYPHSWWSSGSYMLITFTTDGSVTSRGFNMTWTFHDQVNTDTPFTDSSSSIPSVCGSPSQPIEITYQTNGSIASPNYPAAYSSYLDCAWRITVTYGQYVGVLFRDFCTIGGYDYVHIYDGATTSHNLIASLSGCSNPGPFNSSGEAILITFNTSNVGNDRGFYLEWEALNDTFSPAPVSCGSPSFPVEFWYGTGGSIMSPNYPGNYYNYLNCGWRIIVNTWQTVGVEFLDFCTESSYDYVRVYDGPTTAYSQLAYLTGCSGPAGVYNSTGQYLLITFTSDHIVNNRGFWADWVAN